PTQKDRNIYKSKHCEQIPCNLLIVNGLCHGFTMPAFMRLPCLPPLKDEYGECLWYAVSGSHQQGQKSNLQTMNWDAVSYLDMTTPDGVTSLSGGNPHARAVAVIFSAGPPIAGQNRTPLGTDIVTQCGGNYDAANYLDSNAGLSNWFAAPAANHAAGVGSPPPTAPKQFLASPLPGGSQALNDRAVYITSDDIFRVVRRRGNFVEPTLSAMALCLNNYYTTHGSAYPLPDPDNNYHAGEKAHRGRIPAVCLNPLPADQAATSYAEHFYYFRCDNGNSSCLRAYGSTPCKAAVVFGGARTSAQSRSTATERNGLLHPENYLESPGLEAFNTGEGSGHVDLGGIPTFNPDSPSTDVVRCLNQS
ncbi:MAG: hypothetical protein PHU46_15325, partial [Rhodocyclaceae bacterium]|nr:hypothetical protein [Rhodocyclaceae bacterium]